MDVYKHTREAVRVKVRKCEPNMPPEWRKFSVDPQITTLEVLYSLLAKAFEIKSDFTIKYKAFDPAGNEIYLSVLSDWDLDAAFLRIHNLSIQTSSEPCLVLKIDVKPFTEVKECELETPTAPKQLPQNVPTNAATSNARDIMTQSIGASQKYVQNMQTRLPGLIMNQMEKTFSLVQKAFNLTEENIAVLPPRPPLSDNEFRMFLDALGQIQRTDELRKVIFFGGIEPGLRRVVWKHLLNVYPNAMNGHQRMDYMRRKSEQYFKLRETWKNAIKQGCVDGELGYVTSMVKKDVLRTDRLHPFYSGSDDNQNIASLFNILTTYALNHPTVSYCQGMSDIASPLLVTMNDEAQTYICFCAIMFRVRGNFLLDGIAMTQKFAHLTEALSFYDPEFWEYLKSQQADDLLFCYRWLLLELKREFPFDDALRMLEVQWSSLKYETSVQNELSLFEKEFVPILETSAPTIASSLSSSVSTTNGGATSPTYLLNKPRENAYTKFCALRRQSSTASLSSLGSSIGSTHGLNVTKRLNQSLDENISRHLLIRRQRQAHQSLDESKMLMLSESSEKEATNAMLEPTTAHEQSNQTEATHFQFHHTNPFKEDAQQTVNPISASFIERKPIAHVFLNSSSSSIAEDDSHPTQELPCSIAKLQNKNILTNYNAVSNIIAKQFTANASTVSETMKRVGNSGGGHFKDLKEKIAATSKKGLSIEEINSNTVAKPQKLIKNFNEFLNLSKSQITEKLATASLQEVAISPNSTIPNTKGHSVVQLTKSSRVPSLEDSDSTCSVPDTTWSNSTAATAIQQVQSLNFISYEQLEKSTAVVESTFDIEALQLKENEIKLIQRNFGNINSNNCNKYRLNFSSDEEYDYDNASNDDEVFMTPQKTRRNTTSFDSGTSFGATAKFNPFIDDNNLFIPNSTSLPEVLVPISTDENIATNINAPIELATNVIADEEQMEIVTKSAVNQHIEQLNGLPLSLTLPPAPILPAPQQFGGGNPFLMFLCLTLLLQHRNTIMKSNMDYNEIAMHFDKMVRKHDVTRVLNQARRMYIDYLKVQNTYKQRLQSVASAASKKGNSDLNSTTSAATSATTTITTKTV